MIAGQTQLKIGQAYSGAQVDDAIDRVRRLPFVLRATYTVDDGLLVIDVVETKPLFVSGEAFRLRNSFDGDDQTEELASSGFRWFVRPTTAVQASTDFDRYYAVGATQYNLFGGSGFVTLNVRFAGEDEATMVIGPDGSLLSVENDIDPSPELVASVPLAGNHSLRARWEHVAANGSSRFNASRWRYEATTDIGEIVWLYDTTNDSFMPTAGTHWRSGVDFYHARGAYDTGDTSGRSSFESREYSTRAAKYLPITAAVSAIGEVFGSQVEFSSDDDTFDDDRSPSSYGAGVGFSASLWPSRLTSAMGDLRFETRARYSFGEDAELFHATAAIGHRNAWGTVRAVFMYQDAEFDQLTADSKRIAAQS